MDYHLALNIFPFIESMEMKPKKISENQYNYFDNKFKVFTTCFSDYLKFKVNGK